MAPLAPSSGEVDALGEWHRVGTARGGRGDRQSGRGHGTSGGRWGRPLPKQLSQDQIRTLFVQIVHPMDHAVCLLMLRCGLRVSEVARLRLSDIDWTQQSLRIEQGKGRKDRIVYVSADVLAALRTCLPAWPAVVPGELGFWNQKRPHRPLSPKGIQKKMERYAKAAGIKASCHSLRHTFASNLLEAGAEVIMLNTDYSIVEGPPTLPLLQEL